MLGMVTLYDCYGGPRTTEGSYGIFNVNLEIVRQDMVGGLRDMQIKFAEELIKVLLILNLINQLLLYL
jgi:hypothetical protein